MPVTFFDLFAGIGGFRLAFERLGWMCVGFCEVDKPCRTTYFANYRGAVSEWYAQDATKTKTGPMPEFDVLAAGFPCQSFSLAGKRGGFEDTRGTLFFEIARILKDKKPKAFLLENVKGLLSHDKGKTMQTILGTLKGLGYDVHYKVLNSKDFGVPQNRERVFFVGFRTNEKMPFEFPKGFPLKLRLKDILEQDVSEKYYLPDKYAKKLLGGKTAGKSVLRQSRGWESRKDDVSHAVKGGEGGHSKLHVVEEPKIGVEGELYEGKQAGRVFDKQGISKTLQTPSGGHSVPMVTEEPKEEFVGGLGTPRKGMEKQKHLSRAWSQHKRVYNPKGLAQTLSAQEAQGRYNILEEPKNPMSDRDQAVKHGRRVRRLTPRECARLQGFPDWFTFRHVSETQAYKELGNAVSVPVVVAIARQMEPWIWWTDYQNAKEAD